MKSVILRTKPMWLIVIGSRREELSLIDCYVAVVLPRPWEQYLKANESVKITPSLVQRDFSK